MNNPTYRLGLLTVAVALTLARPATSSAQNLYAASFNNSTASSAPDGTASTFASPGLSGPFGLAFDAAGNLYAANRSTVGTSQRGCHRRADAHRHGEPRAILRPLLGGGRCLRTGRSVDPERVGGCHSQPELCHPGAARRLLERGVAFCGL